MLKLKPASSRDSDIVFCGNPSVSSFLSLLVAPCGVTESTNRFGCVEVGTTKHLEKITNSYGPNRLDDTNRSSFIMIARE